MMIQLIYVLIRKKQMKENNGYNNTIKIYMLIIHKNN